MNRHGRSSPVVALVMSSLAFALATLPAAADLALEVSAPKTDYLLFEPLFVTVTLTNTGPEEVRLPVVLDTAMQLLSFEITAPGEPPHPYRPWVVGDFGPDGPAQALMTLGAGERYSADADLTYEMGEDDALTVLNRPGEYRIRAFYSVPAQWPKGPLTVSSDKVRLVVSQPQGANRAAFDILTKVPRHGFWPWSIRTQAAPYYRRIRHRYPQSAYAPYASYYLAQLYHSDGTDRMRGTREGRSHFEAAPRLHLSAADRVGDTPFGLHARMWAGRVLGQLGSVQKAQQCFEDVFLSPHAADDMRIEILSSMTSTETDILLRYPGHEGIARSAVVYLPLEVSAQALGFSVTWDEKRESATVTGPRVSMTVVPSESAVTINGDKLAHARATVKNGAVFVSPSAIRTMMLAHRGRKSGV